MSTAAEILAITNSVGTLVLVGVTAWYAMVDEENCQRNAKAVRGRGDSGGDLGPDALEHRGGTSAGREPARGARG